MRFILTHLLIPLAFAVECATENPAQQALLRQVIAKPQPLGDKQGRFSTAAAKLILQAEEMGYRVTLGEAWRSPEQAAFRTKFNAEKGIGIADSLHTQRLAIDLNLFVGREALTAAQYKPLGEWWEKQCSECRWGGRFKMVDAPHFSFAHEGKQ